MRVVKRVVVAIVASRAPGLPRVRDWVVRPLHVRRDFNIKLGIYLVQPPHELDLHNNFDFQELRYSVAERTLCLQWRRSQREGSQGHRALVAIGRS